MLRRLLKLVPQQGLEYPSPASLVQPAVGSFHLKPQERIVSLEVGFNFRDVGGYPTASGQKVRSGRIYRSGQLAKLSFSDIQTIRKIGPRAVIDLRSEQEVVTGKSQFGDDETIRYLHRPVTNVGNRLRQIMSVMVRRDKIPEVMYEGYTKVMIDGNALVFGNVLKQLADPENQPAIVNCTAGKDRTGIVIALLLTVLGVPEKIILADYSLSNLAYDQLIANLDGELQRVTELGIPISQMQPVFTADPNLLLATLAYTRGKYGSIEAYLLGPAGLTPATFEALQETLLI